VPFANNALDDLPDHKRECFVIVKKYEKIDSLESPYTLSEDAQRIPSETNRTIFQNLFSFLNFHISATYGLPFC
jgi:hypothetical protein